MRTCNTLTEHAVQQARACVAERLHCEAAADAADAAGDHTRAAWNRRAADSWAAEAHAWRTVA